MKRGSSGRRSEYLLLEVSRCNSLRRMEDCIRLGQEELAPCLVEHSLQCWERWDFVEVHGSGAETTRIGMRSRAMFVNVELT